MGINLWEQHYLNRANRIERAVYAVGCWLMRVGMFVQRWAVAETNRRESLPHPEGNPK